jgi:HAD superfamily hydrolase (TIGR01490 family)
VDRRSRSRFNVVFYRRYAGLPAQDLRDWHRQTFADNLQRTISVEALACIRNHQGRGHRIVLVTGGLDLVMRPLAEYLRADELIATHLAEVGGRFTGALDGPPIADAYKATLIRGYAQRHGIVLEQSYAYGNSIGDAPMLACVSNAVAVNADRRLRRLADAGGWRKEQWRSA